MPIYEEIKSEKTIIIIIVFLCFLSFSMKFMTFGDGGWWGKGRSDEWRDILREIENEKWKHTVCCANKSESELEY